MLECGISNGILNGNPLFVLTTVQTSGCMLSKGVALGGHGIECVPFERELA